MDKDKKFIILGGLVVLALLLLRRGNGTGGGGDIWTGRLNAANASANDATYNANSVVDNATEQITNLIDSSMSAYERRREQGRQTQQQNYDLWTGTMNGGLNSQFF